MHDSSVRLALIEEYMRKSEAQAYATSPTAEANNGIPELTDEEWDQVMTCYERISADATERLR